MKIRRSLAATIIAIFLVFNVFSILLFTYYTKAEGETSALDYAKQSMQEIVNEKGELIAIRFDRLRTSVDILAMLLEEEIRRERDMPGALEAYSFNADGSIKRKMDSSKPPDAQSNILAVWNEENRDALAREILLTEKIDEPMGIVLRNEKVTWGYIVTGNNLLRVSPYISLDTYFDDSHRQNEDVFYTMADPAHNPAAAAVITKPYNDYLGEGWTITCSKPIYDGQNEMFGVVCLDVSLKKLREQFFVTPMELSLAQMNACQEPVRMLAELALERGVPIVSCMGTGNKLDPSAFEIADIYETGVCPLCRVMRRELKKRGIPGLTVLYSREKPLVRGPVPGSVSFVPPAAGLMLAGYVIRQLLGGNGNGNEIL